MKLYSSLLLLYLLVLLGGCASYNEQTLAFREAWDAGDLISANEHINELAEKAPEKDQIIIRLEQATVLQNAARALEDPALHDQSYQTFNYANQMISKYFPDDNSFETISIGSELAGNAANLGEMPYKSYVYDRIMMDIYLLLHKLQRGETDKILPAINSLNFKQDSAIQYFSKAIEKEIKEKTAAYENQSKENYQVSKALEDPAFNGRINQEIFEPSQVEDKVLHSFFNPVVNMLSGIYYTHKGDKGIGGKQLDNISRFVRGSIVNDIKNTTRGVYTYVFIEDGAAPMREEVRIDIPVFMFAAESHVPYAGAAFPKLDFRSSSGLSYVISTSKTSASSTLLADFDVIISKEFNKRLAGVIARTLASAGTKIMAQYVANKAVDVRLERKRRSGQEITMGDIIAQGLIKAGTAIWAAGTSRADTRTWTTLPGKVHIVRVPTPADGSLALTDNRSGVASNIMVTGRKHNIVYCRMLNGIAKPLVIFNFSL